jgi:hypothetical protein
MYVEYRVWSMEDGVIIVKPSTYRLSTLDSRLQFNDFAIERA